MKNYTIEFNLLGAIDIEAEDAEDAREQFNELSLSFLSKEVSDCELVDCYAED